MITVGGNADGVWNIDKEHCVAILWLFLAYRAIEHDGGFGTA